MSQRIVGRVVAAGCLAAVLAVASPIRAEARDFSGPTEVWHWVARAWQSGLSALWSWSTSGETQGGTSPCASPNASCPTTPGSTTQGDQGWGLDPNG